MAVAKTAKTKAELEVEARNALARAERAENELRNFKARVPEVMAEKIEQYDLDLCPSGIQDFCNTLGIDTPSRNYEATLTIVVSGLSLKGRHGRWGVEFDDEDLDNLLSALESRINSAVKDNAAEYSDYLNIDIDVEG